MPVTLLDRQRLVLEYPDKVEIGAAFVLARSRCAMVTLSSSAPYKFTVNAGDPTRIWIAPEHPHDFQVAVFDGDTIHVRRDGQVDVVMEMDWERARRVTVHIEKGPDTGYRRV